MGRAGVGVRYGSGLRHAGRAADLVEKIREECILQNTSYNENGGGARVSVWFWVICG